MKKTPPPIHFIITGGTIDSYYEGTKDTAVPNKKSVIPDYLKILKLYQPIKFTTVCMKDSRQINNTDRNKIVKKINSIAADKIIITHGTYTMSETAKYLQKKIKNNNKTIILTGSMIPMNGFTNSDGPFNLGFAMASLAFLQPGIYVCMNGQLFSSGKVKKNIQEGRFISVL